MALPVLTTAEDVRELVRYLKNKPTGATLTEAKAAVRRQALDGRKLSAYQTWGFITKEGERLRLTQRGWDYARKPESEPDIYRRVIDSITAYKSVLEWAHHQGLAAITNVDVAAHWHEHHGQALGTDNENTIKDNAVCFFHVCQAAGVGTLVIGRMGQSTRLDIDKEKLKEYIESGPSAPPWVAPPEEELGQPPRKQRAGRLLRQWRRYPCRKPQRPPPRKLKSSSRFLFHTGATWIS